MPIPAVVFVVGALILSGIVIRREKLGIKDAILVMIGMKSYNRTPMINILTLVVFVAPIVLWYVLYQACISTL